jgi:hypothetical protein
MIVQFADIVRTGGVIAYPTVSPAVRAVRDASQAPVKVSLLADLLSSAFPGTRDRGALMLEELVRLCFLITSLRPPMTTDALGHFLTGLALVVGKPCPGCGGLLLGLVAKPAQVELYPLTVDDDDDARAFSAGGHQVVIQGGQQHVIAVFQP